jgi:hypothetical protein
LAARLLLPAACRASRAGWLIGRGGDALRIVTGVAGRERLIRVSLLVDAAADPVAVRRPAGPSPDP